MAALMDQDGQRIRLAPGDITAIDSCRPCDFRFDNLSRQLSLLVPRPVMHAALHHAKVGCAERLRNSANTDSLSTLNLLPVDLLSVPDVSGLAYPDSALVHIITP